MFPSNLIKSTFTFTFGLCVLLANAQTFGFPIQMLNSPPDYILKPGVNGLSVAFGKKLSALEMADSSAANQKIMHIQSFTSGFVFMNTALLSCIFFPRFLSIPHLSAGEM